MSHIDVSTPVCEAQAVLQLVAGKLRTSDSLGPEEAFTLYGAVTVAIARLDAVHDALHASTGAP